MILFWIIFKHLDPVSLETATRVSSAQFFAGITQAFYGWQDHPAQNRIAVVEITDETLKAAHEAWPLPYDLHNAVLEQILAAGAAGVLVDVRFAVERGGQSLHSFDGAIAMAKARGVPLLFSRGAADTSWDDLPPPLDAYQAITGWEAEAGFYPLLVRHDNAGPPLPTAALALYRSLCGAGFDGCPDHARNPPSGETMFREAMSVRWGARVDPLQTQVNDVRGCDRFGGTGLARTWEALQTATLTLFGATRGWIGHRCFYELTMGAEQLSQETPDGIPKAQLLAGRVVFYGADLLGEHDLVAVPLLGQVPGVALHAMAFDNLLTYGPGYYHEPSELDVLGLHLPVSELAEFGAWIVLVMLTSLRHAHSGAPGRDRRTSWLVRLAQAGVIATAGVALLADLAQRGSSFGVWELAGLYGAAALVLVAAIGMRRRLSRGYNGRLVHVVCVIIAVFVLNELLFRWPGSDWFGFVLLWFALREAGSDERDGFVQGTAHFLERGGRRVLRLLHPRRHRTAPQLTLPAELLPTDSI